MKRLSFNLSGSCWPLTSYYCKVDYCLRYCTLNINNDLGFQLIIKVVI